MERRRRIRSADRRRGPAPQSGRSRDGGHASAGPNRREDGEWVAGRRPVAELLRSGRPIDRLVVADGARYLEELIARGRAAGAVVQVVPRGVLQRLTGTDRHQGIAARAAPVEWADLDELLQLPSKLEKGLPPLLLVLDHIVDPHNAGALLRSADGAGAAGAIMASRRAAPLSAVAVKASAGALEHLRVARVSSVAAALLRMRDAGFLVVGADPGGDRLLWDVPLDGPVAVVVGSEGEGMSELVRRRCSVLVKVPMLGKTESLNASVAGALLLYEVRRQQLARSG